VRGATVPGPAVVPASSPPDDRAGGISAEDDPARGAVPADDRTSGGPPEARTVGKADRTGARPSEDDGASRRAARTRRTEDVSPDDVLAALRSGLSNASQIAVHLHVPAPLVRRRLRELERAGRVRRRPQTVR
jgi:hypothetical protein